MSAFRGKAEIGLRIVRIDLRQINASTARLAFTASGTYRSGTALAKWRDSRGREIDIRVQQAA
jgi:hypothetical protein